MSRVSFVCTWLTSFNSSYSFVQPCLSQEGQNVIYFDVFEHISWTIHFEKLLSDDSESSAFNKNVFNRASCLKGQTLWFWFLFQNERVSKLCMTNAQSGYNDLFSSWFSKSWSPFSQGGLNLEEFIIDVNVSSLLPFCVKEFTDCRFQIGICNGDNFRALSFPLTPMWLGIQHKIIFLWLDIESSLLSSLTINGFSSFLFFSDVNTESESENMIYLLCP